MDSLKANAPLSAGSLLDVFCLSFSWAQQKSNRCHAVMNLFRVIVGRCIFITKMFLSKIPFFNLS